MKTAYLLRQATWMTQDERRVARYVARNTQAALCAHTPGIALPPTHNCAIFALGSALILFQRVQGRLAEALASNSSELVTLCTALEHTQAAFLRAQAHVDHLNTPTPDDEEAPSPARHPQ